MWKGFQLKSRGWNLIVYSYFLLYILVWYIFVMIYLIIILFLASTIFLWFEILKKFTYMQEFIWHSDQMIVWHYDGKKKPWMYTIVLHGSQNFAVLLWFKLKIFGYSGIDHFGFVESNKHNKAIFSTYLWKQPIEFYFLSNSGLKNNPIIVTCTGEDQKSIPSKKFPPHWWQKIGFYA